MLRDYEQPLELEVEAVNRRSREYVRWVQRSLNQIMGSGLVVDGILGRRTRRAIRRFQSSHGLTVDGIVGRRTQAALISAGAGPPPGTTITSFRRGRLVDLARFSRRYVRSLIAAGKRIDCADLAIELWIRFGEQSGIPVSFRIWDARNRRWLNVDRRGIKVRSTGTRVGRFSSTSRFVRYVQGNLGARGLIRNTYPVPGGHRGAVPGDVFLWEYINDRTRRKHRWGHTQIVDGVIRGARGPGSDHIRIVQGSLPPIVPVFRTYPVSYFYRPRVAMMTTSRGKEPHTGVLVGSEPRRFNGFRNLR